ncbi:type VII secretion-associated serine protease mycosin [Streptomyces sp. NPDC006704]|uniref:type VII secretion-associated serine protease mycosin n=1 Tax=Streptomyces sp. NPDC006704 TaxID=3364760 RepID=UPI0036BA114C
MSAAAAPASASSTRDEQWFLDAMKAQEMWRTSTGKGIVVAVIDTGVDPNNPDLKGQVLPGRNFATGEPGDERTDSQGHGTGMAGLIAGTGAYGGGDGAFGLAPGAKILPVRMPAEVASGAEGTKRFNAIAPGAIRYAADQGARIINVSMGVQDGSAELSAAVRYALGKGSLVFAAVGNSGDSGNRIEYPAATPGVVGVGAVGKDLHRTAWSEYGSQVDMAAPGVEMVHACGGGSGLCKTDGTSDATALASASAALIWSKHPEWTNNQVLRVMLNTIGGPTDGAKRNDSIGYGIVRPRVALVNPGDPGPADVYPLPDPPTSGTTTAPATPTPPGTPAKDAAPRADKSAGNRSTLLILAGVAALGIVVALLGVWALRKRRREQAAIGQAQHAGWGPPPGPGPGWSEQQHHDRTGRY